MTAGSRKSNMPISLRPISATETTSRLVEVPIVIPHSAQQRGQTHRHQHTGGRTPVRIATLTRIRSSRTTIGVLLTKALSSAARTRVSSSDSCGQRPHNLDRIRPSGSSAPVQYQCLSGHHQRRAYRHQCLVAKTGKRSPHSTSPSRHGKRKTDSGSSVRCHQDHQTGGFNGMRSREKNQCDSR